MSDFLEILGMFWVAFIVFNVIALGIFGWCPIFDLIGMFQKLH
jgi:hypothetical protein